MNAVECLLKSENYIAAAQLNPLDPDAQIWLELAAAWRMRAIEENHGHATPGHGLFDRTGEIETWNSIGAPIHRERHCAKRASNSGVRGRGS